LKLEILDPALYVYRFAEHLDLSDKANAVALTALCLVGRMKRDWIVAGRRPAGICAAALLIASRAHGFSQHPQDVTRILRVCSMTITTSVREFENTQSASLTLDQFNRVEFETETDPPSFKKNCIREARAPAIQENNIQLLSSGALDDPLAGKNVAKWRDGKTSQKQAAFENLYKSLEEEIKHQASSNTTGEVDEEDGEPEGERNTNDESKENDQADQENNDGGIEKSKDDTGNGEAKDDDNKGSEEEKDNNEAAAGVASEGSRNPTQNESSENDADANANQITE
jgi:hypothetical protein